MDVPPDSPDGLREKIRQLEEENTRLEHSVDEERSDAQDAWMEAEKFEKLLDKEKRNHLSTRKAGLEFMRKIEWCLNGKCPSCGFGPVPGQSGAPRHMVGCELKLAIWRLEAATLPGATLSLPVGIR